MAERNSTVLVGNLPWSTSDEELEEFMTIAGEIISSTVQRHADTHRSKGWGLVKYKTEFEAREAIQMLNGQLLHGRNIHVRMDRALLENSGYFAAFVGNLPWKTTDDDLNKIFEKFDPVDSHVKTNVLGRSRGFGIVRFSDPVKGQAAIDEMDGFEINGRKIHVRQDRKPANTFNSKISEKSSQDSYSPKAKAKPLTPTNLTGATKFSKSVFVGNLAWSTTDKDLAAHFSEIDGIISARIQINATGLSKGWGLVSFDNEENALEAVAKLSKSILNGRPLIVRLNRK